MTTRFIDNESYKHKMAKEVLKQWFEDTEVGGRMHIGDIMFRPNRKSGIFLEYPICSNITETVICPSFDIIHEIMERGHSFDDALKLYDTEKLGPKRDCCDNCQGDYDVICECNTNPTYEEFYKKTHKTYTNSNSWHTNWDEIEGGWDEYVPTYDECVNIYKSYPIAIIDVVGSSLGTPRVGIEICHKNPVSQEKINKLIEAGVDSLIEIDADWILNQTKIPSELKYRRLI